MVFIILRHGQSIWNKQNILAGWTNIKLNEEGILETKNASIILKKYNFDYVFTSDLSRTIQTCNIIKDELKQDFKVIHSSSLKERNYGILSGKTKNELEIRYGKDKIYEWKKTYWGKPPDGENLDDVKYRFGNYYESNIKPLILQNNNILLISHSNAIRAFFVYLNFYNNKTIETFEIENCVPIKIDIYKNKYWYEK